MIRGIPGSADLAHGCDEFEPKLCDCLQNCVRDCMRGILIEMSGNLDVPQQQLLEEFDRLVPDLLARDGTSSQMAVPPAQAPPRLAFEHSCK